MSDDDDADEDSGKDVEDDHGVDPTHELVNSLKPQYLKSAI